MITNEQIEEMFEQQKKIPLMRRAMGLDLPELPKEEHDAWEEHAQKTGGDFKKDTNEIIEAMKKEINK